MLPRPVGFVPPPRTLARWLLVACALGAIGWMLWRARAALTPFAFGLALAYLLMPVVNLLNRRLPRPLAILIVYIAGLALFAGVIAYLVPLVAYQIQQLIAAIPPVGEWRNVAAELFRQYQDRVPPSIRQPIDEALLNALHGLQANVTLYIQRASVFVWGQVMQVINVVSFLVGFFIVPIWLFYVLQDQSHLHAFVDRVLHPRLRADFWNVWDVINHDLSGYLRGQLTLSLLVGVMVVLGMLLLQLLGLGQNYALLLGLIAMVTELIPVVGPMLGAIPGVLIGLSISPTAALAALLVYVVVQQLENSFLVPRIIGESVGIHPAVLTVIIVAAGYQFGLLAVILAAPLAAIARDVFIYAYRRLDGRAPAESRAGLIPEAKPAAKKPQALMNSR